MEKLVSIIVPIYNGEKYLTKCINSLLLQTYKNLEIILIDDGSTDNTENICRQYVHESSKIVYKKKNNQGVSSARNLGIELSKGEYVCFVDCDDFVDENYIECLVKTLKNDDIDIGICGLMKVKENNDLVFKYDFINTVMSQQDILENILSSTGFQGYPVNKIYRKKIISKIDLKFDTSITLFEDLLFLVQYLMNCQYAYVYSLNTYHYVIHNESARNNSILSNEFNLKWITEVEALEKIVKILSDNPACKIAKARLALSSIFYLKRMQECEYKNIALKNRLQKNVRKNILWVYICHEGDLKWRISGILYSIAYEPLGRIRKFIRKR